MENKEISIEKMLLEMIFKMQKLEEKVTELENTVKEMKESERNQTITVPSCEVPNQISLKRYAITFQNKRLQRRKKD